MNFCLSVTDNNNGMFEGVSTLTVLKAVGDSNDSEDNAAAGLFNTGKVSKESTNAMDLDMKLSAIKNALRSAVQKSILHCPVVAARLHRSKIYSLVDCVSCLM